MSGNNRTNTGELIRSEIWQAQLEEILHEQLTGVPFVRTLNFPDGSALTLPSIGTPVVRDLPEDGEAVYDSIDTGEIQMTLNDPVQAGNSVSRLLLEDSMWSGDLMSSIPREHAQAIMERYETDVLALANSQPDGQNDPNTINGVNHRKVAGGTSEVMVPADFAYAGYVLKKSKLARKNLMAIVDPSVAYALETSTNLVNVSNNPRWEGIIESGIEQNFRFVRNVYGFDVFESNLLPEANETVSGVTTTAGVANVFMSTGNEALLPFAVAWRRMPTLETSYDMDMQKEKILTTARWGTGVFRAENLVVILSDTDQVS